MQERRTFRSAVKWAFVMTIGQRGIGRLLTCVLAAVLGPKDFGIVAMAGAYIIFVEMFVAQGMAAAIIQRKDLKDEHLDSVFWLVFFSSVLLAGVSVLLSSLWAAANDLPTLGPVIAVLSISIPIKGLTVVQEALAQRKMDFRNLALLSGASSIIGGVVGVVLAFTGYGVWALVTQQLLGSAIATIILWKVSKWRPRFRFSFKDVKALLGFSSSTFASQFGVYVAGQSDVVIMGLFFGPIAVGLYRLAERLMRILLEIGTRSIQIVALPHFSSLQDDPQQLKRAVLNCMRLSAILTIPALALLAVTSDYIMAVIGSEWESASIVLKIVVFIGMAKALALFSGPLLLAKGYAKSLAALTWMLAIVFTGLLSVCGVLLKDASVETQIVTVALARTIAFLLLGGVVRLLIIRNLCRMSFRDLATTILPSVTAAVAAAVVGYTISKLVILSSTPAIIAFGLVAIPAGLVSILILALLDSTVREFASKPLCWIPNRQRIISDEPISAQ